jgi:hypothetical protein
MQLSLKEVFVDLFRIKWVSRFNLPSSFCLPKKKQKGKASDILMWS